MWVGTWPPDVPSIAKRVPLARQFRQGHEASGPAQISPRNVLGFNDIVFKPFGDIDGGIKRIVDFEELDLECFE